MSFTDSVFEKIIIERNKKVDSAVLGEIQKIAIENGIVTKFILNEKAIVSALEKQIPKKPKTNNDSWFCCRNCGETFSLANTVHRKNKYCGNCGQALDWGDCE